MSRPAVPGWPEDVSIPAVPDLHAVALSGQPLPPAGALCLAGVELGAGRPAEAVQPFVAARQPRRPLLWLTDEPVPDTAQQWRRLVDLFPQTGLWPLVLHPLGGDDRRPWDRGELEPVAESDVDAVDPAHELAEAWAGWLVPIGENPRLSHLHPYGATFPGLAEPLPRTAASTRVPATVLAPWGPARLGLVRCRRPADAVAIVGWLGAINITGPTQVSAVLRSWEERFGVVIAGLGFDTVTLLVPDPPVDERRALPIAAEIAALCPDALRQGSAATLEEMARLLVGLRVWRLWFD